MANTALTLSHSRQNPLVAQQVFGFANIADTGVAVNVIKLPMGAIITDVVINVLVASNIGTSQALAVSGGGATLIAAQDGKATAGSSTSGITTALGKAPLATGGYVTVTPTNVGTAATAGSFQLIVEYIIDGRGTEAQP